MAGVAVEDRLHPPALGEQGGEQLGEVLVGDLGGKGLHRLGQGAALSLQAVEDLLAGRLQQLGGGALLDQGEMGGDPGLERKAAEQGLAEGVDGLDLHPAGDVDHLGEEPPGTADLIGFGRGAEQVAERAGKVGLLGRRPGSERGRKAVAHLGGGGLCEGEAEDASRIGALQHQAQDTVGQNPRLAAAGRGGDPGRNGGVGGASLAFRGGRSACAAQLVGRGHVSPPPPADHSLTRARCS